MTQDADRKRVFLSFTGEMGGTLFSLTRDIDASQVAGKLSTSSAVQEARQGENLCPNISFLHPPCGPGLKLSNRWHKARETPEACCPAEHSSNRKYVPNVWVETFPLRSLETVSKM